MPRGLMASGPRPELLNALTDVLAHDDVAQQLLAIGVLRKLGVRCDGRRFDQDFHWVITELDGSESEIEPGGEGGSASLPQFQVPRGTVCGQGLAPIVKGIVVPSPDMNVVKQHH
jgi:hypothetical protein